jgi:hypothetical protein
MKLIQKPLLQPLEILMTFQRVFVPVLQELGTFLDFPFLIPLELPMLSLYTDDLEKHESRVFLIS